MSKVEDRMLSNQKLKRVPFPIAISRGVRVLIEVSSVYFFYVDLFIYLFIYLFIFFFLCRFFKRTSSARHAKVQCSLALTQSADRFINSVLLIEKSLTFGPVR